MSNKRLRGLIAPAAAVLFAVLPSIGRICELECVSGSVHGGSSPESTRPDHCAQHTRGGDESPLPDPCSSGHGQDPALTSARCGVVSLSHAVLLLPATAGVPALAREAAIATSATDSPSSKPPPVFPVLRL